MKFYSNKISLILLCFLAFGLGSCKDETKHSLPVIKMRYYADNLGLGDYSEAEIKIFDQNRKLIFKGSLKIKHRGNSNYQYSKKSFTLKFDEEISLSSMKPSIYWKLNSEYIDKTFMRNKLSYDLFRQFRKGNYAPKVDYTVLYENEKYQGIYALCEGVDEFRLGLNLKDPGAVLFKEPPFHFAPNLHKRNRRNFEHYSKVDDRYANYSQKAKKLLIKESYYNQRYPNVITSDRKSTIHEITEFLFNSTDQEFKEKIFRDYFDIDNILDWHLLLLITNNGDGIIKNNYFYKTSSKTPFMYCPWDFDHSFGREGDGELITEDICPIENHILFKRLIQLNPRDYRRQLYEKFKNLERKGIISVKQIHKMIDENAQKLRPEIKASEDRWPLDAVDYFKGSDFEKELQLMKDWIENRIPRIERYLEELQKVDPKLKKMKPILIPPIKQPPTMGSAVDINFN